MSKQSNQRYRKEKDKRQSTEPGDMSKDTGGDDKTDTADKDSQGQDKLSHDFTSPTDSMK